MKSYLITGLGICSFAHSLFALLLKIPQINEPPWAIRSGRSWQKSDLSKLLKNERFTRKNSMKIVFFICFFPVFPLFMPKSESLPSLFAQLLFFKELLWANHSGCSKQKSDRERFAPVALYKRATMSDSFRSLMTKDQPWAIHSGLSWQKSNGSESLFCSFAHKKRANRSKNRWSNFQPWSDICVAKLYIIEKEKYTVCTYMYCGTVYVV